MVSDTLPPVPRNGAKSPAKTLTAAELEQSVERLYTRPCATRQKRIDEYNTAVEEQMTHNRLKKPQTGELTDADKTRLDHLYTQPIERKKRWHEQQAAQEDTKRKSMTGHGVAGAASGGGTAVTAEEREAIVDRLYSQSIKMKEQGMLNSTKRVYGDEAAQRQKEKHLDKEQLASSVESLYTKAIEKKKKADESLEEKYGWKKLESPKKITPEEAKALAARLQKAA